MTASRKRAKKKIVRKKSRRKMSRDATDILLSVAGRYINKNGGKCIISGPIQILRWPGESEDRFSLVIKMLGRAPAPKVSP